jgi:hypothetical protein
MRCRFSGLLGPVMLVTIGGLFLVQQFTVYRFGELWPVILIVLGLWKILQYMMPTEGHAGPGPSCC